MERIVDGGNHYVIQLKKNQKTLFEEVERVILHDYPLDSHTEHEKNHGRHSTWNVSTYNALQSDKTKEWKKLSRFIHVHKITIEKGKETHSDRFYISDKKTVSAKYFHQGIRGHWKIENSLHWVKDVVHNEDKNAIKTNNGPVNSAVFSSIAINIHRTKGDYSITDSQIKFRAKVPELFDLIRT